MSTESSPAFRAYINGWYDKSRDDGLRFWETRPKANFADTHIEYLQGMWDRPNSGLRGVTLRTSVKANPHSKVA